MEKVEQYLRKQDVLSVFAIIGSGRGQRPKRGASVRSAERLGSAHLAPTARSTSSIAPRWHSTRLTKRE
ncbi:hypothetical protein M8494_02930 [Serratia ureilytica]